MITARMQVMKRCPFKDEVDRCEVTVTCRGDAPELHRLAEDIAGLSREPVSHEDYARAVARLLPAGSSVTVAGPVGPWMVEVTEHAVLREPVDPGRS